MFIGFKDKIDNFVNITGNIEETVNDFIKNFQNNER